MASLLILLLPVLQEIVAVRLNREIFVVMLARSVKISQHATDMTALLLSLEARLAIALSVLALDNLQYCLRFSLGNLAVLRDDPLV